MKNTVTHSWYKSTKVFVLLQGMAGGNTFYSKRKRGWGGGRARKRVRRRGTKGEWDGGRRVEECVCEREEGLLKADAVNRGVGETTGPVECVLLL